ncbi:RGCVC family protein [Pseudonocardia spinosispora]|uniref:RGCVC family protein n=1 Tax=Pseudonocardia spinosispora TaxID=103441 RepID=UPI0012EB5B9C|nr:RGCVC family protein [Pseudonocardia spinosispora]
MTTEFHERSSGSDQSDACEACGHDEAAHDVTATRYCAATVARGTERGCVCRGQEAAPKAAAAPGRTGAPMYGRGRFSGK